MFFSAGKTVGKRPRWKPLMTSLFNVVYYIIAKLVNVSAKKKSNIICLTFFYSSKRNLPDIGQGEKSSELRGLVRRLP